MKVGTLHLLPCPFCGEGETEVRENLFRNGQHKRVHSYTLLHYCGTPQLLIKIVRPTETELKVAWNKRLL